ncbi:hypothetical protein [Aquimarina sediminis]|uniref:hypothetical protein n=1 Tax=Aquimarina sediminis TaxID=2070536 RepID=UPI000CA0694E|nr:hypothetical protein [Aquimarina sediminis]
MKKIEVVLILGAVLGILFFVLNYPFGAIITIISLLTLSCIYFYFGFALFNRVQFLDIFKKSSFTGISTVSILGAIGAGVALSIVLVGILFKIFRWPFASQNLLIGGIMISVISIFSFVRFLKNGKRVYKEILVRSLLFGSICGVLLFQPNYLFIELKYSDYPDYIEALKKSEADPDNVILQNKEQEEYDKMKEQWMVNK